MYYLIRHVTRYDFAQPIRGKHDGAAPAPALRRRQRALSFELVVRPSRRIFSYRDFLGNVIHHFDVPAAHDNLVIASEALVETLGSAQLPVSLGLDAWGTLHEIVETEDYREMLLPSKYAAPDRAAAGDDRAVRARPARRRSAHLPPPRAQSRVRAFRLCAEQHARRFADRRGARDAPGSCVRTSPT
jgi:transglutaminase-like putative cysteine protease